MPIFFIIWKRPRPRLLPCPFQAEAISHLLSTHALCLSSTVRIVFLHFCTVTMKYAVYPCPSKMTLEKRYMGGVYYVAVGSKWKQWSGNIVSASQHPVLQYISTKAYQPISIPSFYCTIVDIDANILCLLPSILFYNIDQQMIKAYIKRFFSGSTTFNLWTSTQFSEIPKTLKQLCRWPPSWRWFILIIPFL